MWPLAFSPVAWARCPINVLRGRGDVMPVAQLGSARISTQLVSSTCRRNGGTPRSSVFSMDCPLAWILLVCVGVRVSVVLCTFLLCMLFEDPLILLGTPLTCFTLHTCYKPFFPADQARQENSRVLVHCFVGISRSAAVVIAYLMRECSLTLAQSMQFVVSKRPIVKLVCGFYGY